MQPGLTETYKPLLLWGASASTGCPPRSLLDVCATQWIENGTTGRRHALIQQAIDDAQPGDEIIVGPGICQYLENLDFKGKSLILRSTDPGGPTAVAATVINGSQRGATVDLSGSHGAECTLAGLTMINGITGVSCCGARPTIKNCII